MNHLQHLFIIVCIACTFVACQSTPTQLTSAEIPLANSISSQKPTAVLPTSSPLPPTSTPKPTPITIQPTETAVPPTLQPTATPIYSGQRSPACGQQLPLLAADVTHTTTTLQPNGAALAEFQAIMPANAQPALDHILAQPQDVGLVVYRLSEEHQGVFLNPDLPLPLASVAKLITLVAYVEAVDAGQLNPNQRVPLSTLDQYYLPRTDLGTHELAIGELEEKGRVDAFTNSISLDDAAWMMMRHSSNAASDYFHFLLGQERIEQTAVSLNLTQQTAPCPFLSQFLAMANHTRVGDNLTAVRNYIQNPPLYGEEATLLADAFSQDPNFRQTELRWRNGRRWANLTTQQLFGHTLSTQGTAREYAALMGRFAQNGLSNGNSSFHARLLLEWPMQFGDNQFAFDNLGYKNGSLPGIITTAYYAYPKNTTTPVVIALFFRNLDSQIYRSWRFRDLPHDAFARWLLANPEAIPLLRSALNLP